MRHGVFGTKLSRTSNERKRLLVGLAREIFKHGAIRTTLAKAKAVQPMVEKIITRAKKVGNKSKGSTPILADYALDTQVHVWLKNRFAHRTSGYTRIVRLGERLGDSTELVLLSFVDAIPETEIPKPTTDVKKTTTDKSKRVTIEKIKQNKTKKVAATK